MPQVLNMPWVVNMNYTRFKIYLNMFVSDMMNVLQADYLLKGSRQTCSAKKVFLKISQNSQENTCGRVSIFKKLQT